MEYSKEQLEAINSIDGQVCIISVAGSGKTAVIVARADNIVKHGVKPSRILVLTFSKAAAAHMEKRYVDIYGHTGIRFSTIHSLCYSVLVRAYNLKPESVLSDKDKLKFFTEFHKKLVYKRTLGVPDDFDEFYRKCEEYITGKAQSEYYENTFKYIREHAGSGYNICQCFGRIRDKIHEKPMGNDNKSYLDAVYEQYKQYKINNKKLDFDDMVIYCHKCLARNKKELEYWQGVFDYICVDEFQDTGLLQADVIYMTADKKKNICVVGDDDQSIYGFRGVSATIFPDFIKRFPDTKKIILGTNYRSFPYIIKGADKIIRNNQVRIIKDMKSYRVGDGRIHIREASSQPAQADIVISLINEYVKNGGKLSEAAILYRVKKEAAVLVSTLETIGMPFYTRDLVDDVHLGMCYKDMLAYYRLSRGIPEDGDLVRIINRPKRYIRSNLIKNCIFDRNKIYEACTANAQRHECLRINDTINDMFLDFRSLSRIDNPTQFLYYIYNNMGYEESMYEYAEYVGIDKDDIMNQSEMMKKESMKLDNMSEWYNYIMNKDYRQRVDKENGLYLGTFHGAKGLEWKKVIIISANEQITPYAYMGKVDDYEEERRLFYVAMTRARDELDILYVDGSGSRHQRSRFLDELMASYN
ncbi:MAG TPA: hypothetical protein DC028_03290 [Eubacterium sp.]|nr:hypothetical protein [Eubacterium sp.]